MHRAAPALALGILMSACGGGAVGPAPSATLAATPSAPPAKLVVVYGSINGDDLPTWIAKEAGIFSRNGLDVDLQLVSSSSAAMAAVVSGNADVAQTGGSDAVSAVVGGADVVVLAVTSPVYSYVFEVAASIKTTDDLKGKKVGVSSVGSSADVGVRVALRKVGLDPDKDVGILAAGDVPSRTAAMISGAIQGTVVNPPETLALERAGFHPLLDLAALKLPAVLQSSIVKRSLTKDRAPVAQRYVDSLVQAIAYMKANKTFTVGVLKKYFKSEDEAAMSATYDFFTTEVVAALPAPRPELFADAIAVLAAKNDKVKGFDAARIVDDSFVASAAKRGLDRP